MNRIIRLLMSGLVLVGISAGVIGQTSEEDDDFLLSLIPVVMTALYHRPDADRASFADAIEIIAEESQTPQRFDFKLSTYPVGEDVRYSWAFGDSQSAEGVPVSHDYATVGRYTVRLTIHIPGYSAQTLRKQIQVKPINQLPLAQFTASTTSGFAPLNVQFDAGQSADNDGNIVRYAWHFGDGNSATGRTVSHQYQSMGVYTNYAVSLTITDDRGGQANASQYVRVSQADNIPVARFEMTPPAGDAPLDIRFDARGSSDVDGTIVDYVWDFGDGETAQGARVRHSYTRVGAYSPMLTVTDNTGATHSLSQTLDISPANVTPEARIMPSTYQGSAPLQVDFSANDSHDPDGVIADYTWDFGDGQFATGIHATHQYERPGSYQAILYVSDSEGGVGVHKQLISVSGSGEQAGGLRILTEGGLTEQNPLALSGTAVPGGRLSFFVNGEFQSEVLADALGSWAYDIALLDGKNKIRVVQEGLDGSQEFVRYLAYQNTLSRDLGGTTISGTRVLTPGIPPRPYTVDRENLSVAQDATLILQAGVEIQFNSGSGSQWSQQTGLYIDGQLSVRGSQTKPVRLHTNLPDEENKHWLGIHVSEWAKSVLIDHADIQQSSWVLYSEDTPVIIRNSLLKGRVYLSEPGGESRILDSTLEGGFAAVTMFGGGFAEIRGNTFKGNLIGVDLWCIAVDAGTRSDCPSVQINGNNLLSRIAIRLSEQMKSSATRQGIDATGNWWGSTDVSEIGRYKVDFQGFLDGPVPDGKVFKGELYDSQGIAIALDGNVRLAAGQHYFAYSGIALPAQASLTLEAGANLVLDNRYSAFYDLNIGGKLIFEAGSTIESMGDNSINISGALEVNGTSESPVSLTAPRPDYDMERWGGLHILPAAGPVSIDHALIEYADHGVSFDEAGGELLNSMISQNHYGIRLNGQANPLISGNTISNNVIGVYEAGLQASLAGPQAQITENNFEQNSFESVYLAQSNSTGVRHMPGNWWGSVDPGVIAAGIYDHNDNNQRPYLDFSGFLDGPFPQGVAASGNRLELLVIHEDLRLDGSEPYRVLGDIYVPEGVTLTLAQGMRLSMESDQGEGYSLIVDGALLLESGAVIEFGASEQRIEINGSLLISGTAENPVRIASSRAQPAAGDWQGIHITSDASPVNIEYAEIRHAERGVWFDGAKGRLENSVLASNLIGLLASSAAQPEQAQNRYEANHFDAQFFDHEIDPGGYPPRPGFSITENTQASGYTYAFDASDSLPGYGSSYNLVAYAWDFGDGLTASGPQHLHTYVATGRYEVRLDVLDENGGFESLSRDIEVLAPNTPPTAIAGPDQFLEAGETVILDGFQSFDADGSINQHSWRQLSGTPVTLPVPEYGRNTFVMPDIGVGSSLVFELTVSDDRGASATDTMNVTQVVSNIPPEAFAGSDRRRDAGDVVTLDGSFSRDEDGVIEAYQWTQITGPNVILSNNMTAMASFSMPTLLAGQELEFELSVTDDRGAVSSDRVVIGRMKEVTLVSTVSSGIAPLQVYFVIKTDISSRATNYGMDYDGDGVFDKVSTNADGFEYVYTDTGSYHPYVSVLDEQGQSFGDRIQIDVVSKDNEIAAISAQWQAMSQALINGDIEAAMVYIADYKREDYRQLFTSMGTDKLSVLFGNSAEIYLQTLTDNIALCRVVRVEAGGRFMYPMRFLKGNDGVWKLLRF